MIWAVLDTNTLVSGMGWGGVPGRVLDLGLRGRFGMVTSKALLDELLRVLQGPKLAPFFQDAQSLVALVASASALVEPTIEVDMVTEDPADNRVLEAAQAGHVDYVVYGDPDLLDLHRFEGIEIVRPREFLDLMEGPASSED